jgi:hypothetical protein
VITDDEVMRLFEQADPARADRPASAGPEEVIEEPPALESYLFDPEASDATLVDIAFEPEPGARAKRRRSLVAAAAAVLAIAVSVAVVASRHDTTRTEVPVGPDPTPTTGPAAYVAAADSFMDAWVAGDGDAVVALIGDPRTIPEDESVPEDPFWQVHLGSIDVLGDDLPWMGAPAAIRDVAALPALHDWFRAVGWEFHRGPCRLVDPFRPDGGTVACNYTYENDLTRAVGRAPVTELFALDVVDDQVWTISGRMFDADADLWQMFSDWVRSEHPDDFAAMYDANTAPPNPRLDAASIALWERHVDDFVSSPEAHQPPSADAPTRAQFGARARMICAAAALEAPWWGPHEGMARASQNAMEQLRALPRPEEDATQIDQLFSLLEEYNRHVVADTWYHNNSFYDLQDEKNALGGRDFWGCPVGPLGG